MDRRDFIKKAALGLVGLSSGSLALLNTQRSFANTDLCSTNAQHPLLFCIDANGAYDTTSFCDPLLGDDFQHDDILGDASWFEGKRHGPKHRFAFYGPEHVKNVGPFHIAPQSISGGTQLSNGRTEGGTASYYQVNGEDFFEKYQNDLVIVQGIDTQTNAHGVGQRYAWSGRLGVGAPHIGALWAAIRNKDIYGDTSTHSLPMAFTSTGGYDATMGIVPIARASKPGALLNLTEPFAYPLSLSDNVAHPYVSNAIIDQVLNYQNSRTERMLAQANLPPHVQRNIQKLRDARLSEKDLKPLADTWPSMESHTNGDEGKEKMALLIAGMKSGICNAAMLQAGGFDTHSDHYSLHLPLLQKLFETIDFVATHLQSQGLWERSLILVHSDFGRTRLNGSADGKDHWPITSFMMMGGLIEGNREFGGTYVDPNPSAQQPKSGMMPRAVNLETLALDDGGSFITPSHIHYTIRDMLGINCHPLAEQFKLPSEFQTVLPLFG